MTPLIQDQFHYPEDVPLKQKTAKSGINYIFLDHLDFGTYESCKLKLETEKSKQTEIGITKFTIQKRL